jgi:hypothetical protein
MCQGDKFDDVPQIQSKWEREMERGLAGRTGRRTEESRVCDKKERYFYIPQE